MVAQPPQEAFVAPPFGFMPCWRDVVSVEDKVNIEMPRLLGAIHPRTVGAN